MHHELAVYEIQTVASRLPRTVYHVLLLLLRKVRDFVYRFERVLGVRDAEGNAKLEGLHEIVTEVMPFDHDEVLDGEGSHSKDETGANGA